MVKKSNDLNVVVSNKRQKRIIEYALAMLACQIDEEDYISIFDLPNNHFDTPTGLAAADRALDLARTEIRSLADTFYVKPDSN